MKKTRLIISIASLFIGLMAAAEGSHTYAHTLLILLGLALLPSCYKDLLRYLTR